MENVEAAHLVSRRDKQVRPSSTVTLMLTAVSSASFQARGVVLYANRWYNLVGPHPQDVRQP